MASTASTMQALGSEAPAFTLPNTHTASGGPMVSLADYANHKALLVAFICNHCPYVIHIAREIAGVAAEYDPKGIGFVAISSNDVSERPEDGPEAMAEFAEANNFIFPYLYDESQDVARAYEAVCTPDFFGFNADLELQYRGRLDAAGRSPDPSAPRELFDAMVKIAETGQGPRDQTPSVGCTIKWKAA